MNSDPTIGEVLGGMSVIAAILGLLAWRVHRLLFAPAAPRPEPSPVMPPPVRTPPSTSVPSVPQETLKPLVGELWKEENSKGIVSATYDLTIRIELAEREPGIFTKTYFLSRPIAGIQQIESWEGVVVSPGLAQLSLDERYLLIADVRNCWLFDLKENRVRHWEENNCDYYFETPECRGTTIERGGSHKTGHNAWAQKWNINERGELEPPLQWDFEVIHPSQ